MTKAPVASRTKSSGAPQTFRTGLRQARNGGLDLESEILQLNSAGVLSGIGVPEHSRLVYLLVRLDASEDALVAE